MKRNIVFYYGNAVGYVEQDKVILDVNFKKDELENFLKEKGMSAEWRNGVYDRLAERNFILDGDAPVLKSVRIHQLKPDSDIMEKFISYEERLKKGYGEPFPSEYDIVYDGEIETNDLEEIWVKFNQHHPAGYQGHSLSMSDVVELYDGEGSSFYYVDRFGFKEVGFEEQIQEETESHVLKF